MGEVVVCWAAVPVVGDSFPATVIDEVRTRTRDGEKSLEDLLVKTALRSWSDMRCNFQVSIIYLRIFCGVVGHEAVYEVVSSSGEDDSCQR